MPAFNIDIRQTAYLFVRLHGDGAAERARKMAEIMRSKGDNEGADTWLRIMVAIRELRGPPTEAGHQRRAEFAMARRSKHRRPNQHTISQEISTTLKDGAKVTGTLWLHPSRRGSFEVEYNGRRASDHRNDYTSETAMKGMARTILREMAEGKTPEG
jgi:hypothetical protein